MIGDAPLGDRRCSKAARGLRFLTGRGTYLDDLAFDSLAHAIVLRSPHAHALIRDISVADARAVPGVLAVLTAGDARANALERAAYDPASGQLLAGSFMDYALPRADDLPSFDLSFNGTRCTTNPLGVNGCGEAGAVGAFPAATSAILDALAPFGITEVSGPATSERIWRAIRAATAMP